MTDGKIAHQPMQRTGAAPGLDMSAVRERVREIIRQEVDRLNPTEDARRPLELIIESSLRYSTLDGTLRITVVDPKGQPRTVQKDGQVAEFTLRDLIEELRANHPILFRPPMQGGATSESIHPQNDHAPAQSPQREPEPESEPEPPVRDWLDVGTSGEPSTTSASSSLRRNALFHLRHGQVRLHGWTRKALASLRKPAPVDDPTRFPEARPEFPLSAEGARTFIKDVRTRAWPIRPGLALGAVALAAVLGLGAFALLGSDDPEPSAVDTAARAAAPAASPEDSLPDPVTTGSSNARTLRGAPDVIDTATLSLQGEVVRLFGVEWAPGGGKPEDLTSYLQGREVVCEPAGANDTYRCQVGAQDLSRVVLFNGGGRPTSEATPELKAAAERAREAKIGVWSQQ